MRRVDVNILEVEKGKLLHNLSVFLALVIQHAMRMRQVFICGLPRSTTCFTLPDKLEDFWGKYY